ncbi:MAG: CC/Se motif family (seleno)protein [Solibacillus sp.]
MATLAKARNFYAYPARRTNKNWLHAKGKLLVIKTLLVNSCCAPSIKEVTTQLGKPKDWQYYNEIQLDGLTIFVEKPLASYEKMTLKLKGIGLFKMVSVRLS